MWSLDWSPASHKESRRAGSKARRYKGIGPAEETNAEGLGLAVYLFCPQAYRGARNLPSRAASPNIVIPSHRAICARLKGEGYVFSYCLFVSARDTKCDVPRNLCPSRVNDNRWTEELCQMTQFCIHVIP